MDKHELRTLVADNQLVPMFLMAHGLENSRLEFVPAGYENHSTFVSNEAGAWVLRIYKPEGKSIEQIQREIHFMDYLSEHGLQVPKPVPNLEGELITNISSSGFEFYAILTQRLPGVHPEQYTPEIVKEMARTMAHFHELSTRYVEQNPHMKTELATLRDYFVHEELDLNIFDSSARSFFERSKEFSWDISQLPKAIIHKDFHLRNLLFENGSISAILDFDDSYYSALLEDIAVVVYFLISAHLAQGVSADLTRVFLAEYQQHRLLTSVETNSFKQALLYRNFNMAGFYASYKRSEYDVTQAEQIADFIKSL